MQRWLSRAAGELGIRISLEHVVVLADGRNLRAEALFPDLGAQRGTLVFDAAEQLDAIARKELLAQGYTASSFHQPSVNEQFDLASYAEMFSDWGWAGTPEEEPAWMRRNES